jgi:hypothetical protein
LQKEDQGLGDMLTKTKIVFIGTVLGITSSASAMAEGRAFRQTEAPVERQISAGAEKSDSSLVPDQTSQLTGTYFDPSPAPFKAYTYSASARLHPSASRRVWHAELTFPAFNALPTVSVQIISSISAVPMQVKSLKIVENPASSAPIETQIIVEAEPIFDGVPSGFYFANLVVIGVPVMPPGDSPDRRSELGSHF